MGWETFDEGTTLGQLGDENGLIMGDEEYDGICRITLEQGGAIAPFAITCGIYGWFFHTRFFGDAAEAVRSFEAMQPALATIVESIPLSSDADKEDRMVSVGEAISQFVEKFP